MHAVERALQAEAEQVGGSHVGAYWRRAHAARAHADAVAGYGGADAQLAALRYELRAAAYEICDRVDRLCVLLGPHDE